MPPPELPGQDDPSRAPTGVTPRLRRRIERDFPALADEVAGLVTAATDRLAFWAIAQTPDGRERIQAALVFWAAGDLDRLGRVIAVCDTDWRDALVQGGVANADWPQVLDRELGPAS